ncbi:thrombospondin type 1 domain protein, partial [Cooperia oncophora]
PRIDVKWSSWSAWSDCSATCGEAVQKRQRYCENAKPYPDKGCEGNLYETRSCSLAECTGKDKWRQSRSAVSYKVRGFAEEEEEPSGTGLVVNH